MDKQATQTGKLTRTKSVKGRDREPKKDILRDRRDCETNKDID